MPNDIRMRGYRREEFALIAILLAYFIGIVAFSLNVPFDARLFPQVIGGAGILLMLAVGIERLGQRSTGDGPGEER